MFKIKVSKLFQLYKRKEVIMFYTTIVILLIMSWINKTMRNLEHQQQILCYDLQILSQKIKEDESRIW